MSAGMSDSLAVSPLGMRWECYFQFKFADSQQLSTFSGNRLLHLPSSASSSGLLGLFIHDFFFLPVVSKKKKRLLPDQPWLPPNVPLNQSLTILLNVPPAFTPISDCPNTLIYVDMVLGWSSLEQLFYLAFPNKFNI